MTELKAGLAASLPPPEWLVPRSGPAAGMRLAFRAYSASGSPRAHVLISHGFSEHSGWWQHVALALQASGVSAYLFDHYHHGQSDGRVADVPSYDVLAAGLALALEEGVLPRAGSGPVVLLGHSNGGLASLHALPRLAGRLRGLVLCSPLMRMLWVTQWLGVIPAWTMSVFQPGAYWPLPEHPDRLTSVAALWPQYEQDPLRFHKITPRFYLAMRAASARARARTDVDGLPLLLLSAEDELVVDRPAMLRWYERLAAADKTHIVHPGCRHELFNEREWLRVVEEVVSWIAARCATP
jgi:alpha-beta hydrolase superfamily lysophospholipase